MNFTELCAEVATLTRRPDQTTIIESAVRAATLKSHQSDYYYRDIFETGVSFPSADYVQNFEYKSVIPRWRAVKYLRKYDNATGTPGVELELILPENLFDSYKIQRQDIFYAAGMYLQINSSTQEQYYLLGCYLHPEVSSASYESWIAADYPYAIIYSAAATVFRSIGKDEEGNVFRQLASEELIALRSSNITAGGF